MRIIGGSKKRERTANNMQLKCKDCGEPADPTRTMKAADYGCTGPDLHFCKKCDEESDAALAREQARGGGILN